MDNNENNNIGNNKETDFFSSKEQAQKPNFNNEGQNETNLREALNANKRKNTNPRALKDKEEKEANNNSNNSDINNKRNQKSGNKSNNNRSSGGNNSGNTNGSGSGEKKKKLGGKKSNALENAQSKLNNAGSGDHETSEGEEVVNKATSTLAKAGDKAISLAEKGLKAVWLALPMPVKIGIIIVGLLALLILIIVFSIVGIGGIYSSVANTMCNGQITYNDTKISINDYIKGTLYNEYQENDYDLDNKEFVRAYSIYVRSVVYDLYLQNDAFDASDISALTYNDKYKTAKEDDAGNDIANYTDTLLAVDETENNFFENPKEITKEEIKTIYEKTNTGVSYENALKDLSDNPDSFKITTDLNDICKELSSGTSCTLVGGQSITVPLTAPTLCPVGVQGSCQCAGGVHQYMTDVLLKDKPELLQKFYAFRSKYTSTGCNPNSMDADSYYHGGIDGEIFKASNDPAPGDIWAQQPGPCQGRRTSSGVSYYGAYPMHVYVVTKVIDSEHIEVFECNGKNDEACYFTQKTKTQYQKGIFIHVLGECK